MSKDGTRIGSLKQVVELRARIAELEAELERERVRVAACGVVAMANTRDSAREARQVLPEYRSALLCDVERAVDREMAERERREAAEAELAAERKRRAAHAVVTWFAGVMEECLRDNDHKDGWSHCSQRFLLTRLFEEAFELKAAIESGALPVEIEREAADVANFAMMIADVCDGDGRRTHDEKEPT